MITASIIFSLVASILCIFVPIFLMAKDWKDQIARYFSFFTLSAFGILFTMFLTYAFPDSLNLTLVNRVTQLSTLLTFSSLFTLSFVFPRPEKRFPFWISATILVPAVVIGLLVAFTDITITAAYFKEGSLERDFKPFYTIYAGIAFTYLIAALISVSIKYARLKVEIYRLQMRYLFLGGAISVFMAANFSIIMPRFFDYSDLYVFGPAMATFVMVGALFYSIIAYHILDIATVIHKTMVYIVISMLISLPIYGIIRLYEEKVWMIGDIPYYVVAVVIVLVFILFSVFMQPVIDRAFKRKQYEFGDIVDNFIIDAGALRDLDSIIRMTVDTLHKSLYLKHAFFIMLDDKSRKYELLYYQGGDERMDIEPVDRNSSVIRWFVRNQDLLFLGRIYTDERSFADIREDISGFYTKYNVHVILPVYHERRVLGLLCLGEKETLSGFNTDEIDKLKQFHARSSGYISNALTYKEVMKQQLIARTVDLSSSILSKTVPSALPNIGNIKFGAFIVPKYEEGSDYFDFIRPGEKGIGVIATDISGVGINSALYSLILRSSFQASINDAPSTSSVMQNLNRILFEYSKGKGGLVTAYYLYYDIPSMRLMYTNAGFPALEIFRVEKNNFDTLDTEGIPLGYDTASTYGIGKTGLIRGDIGILYTKTLISSKNQKGEEFGLLRLRNIIMESRMRSASDIAERIKNNYVSFMGVSTAESDVLALVFKIV